MAKKRVQRLRVLLLKDSLTDNDALKDKAKLKAFNIEHMPFKAKLYLEKQSVRQPSWIPFVQAGIKTSIPKLTNSIASAVLIVDAKNRRLAFTFGFGRNLLNQDSFERDFGLKVALNTIDPENLRSVDVRTIEELTLHTRRRRAGAQAWTPLV